LATCWLIVLAPRSRRPRLESVRALSMDSKSKPSCSRNFWSSAAITATAAWREISDHGTHSCCRSGAGSRSMKAVAGTGSQRNITTTRTESVAAESSATAADRAIRAGQERRLVTGRAVRLRWRAGRA
jgi:hypothetical protein